MRQLHLDSAVARVTGESLRTIQQRGFGLIRLDSDRSQQRTSSAPANSDSQPSHADHTVDNLHSLISDR